jgi:predicted unusual protein kinase regulating ubiquinone biosynthesis (AarF/ABC1/UbiB family)
MTWQVVVLDHGMYRRLREDVRRSYGSLWKAFMTR